MPKFVKSNAPSSLFPTSVDTGYIKSGHRLRRAVKRPPTYDANELFKWSAMNEQQKQEREEQKRIAFLREQEQILLKRRRSKV